MSTITRLESTTRLSRVVVHNGTAYFSGLTATNRGGGIEEQTAEVLAKADDLLAKVGADRTNLLIAQVWLRDIGDFSGMNAVWEAWIDPDHPPARATVESKLAADDIRIEIRFTAAVDTASSAHMYDQRTPDKSGDGM